MAMAKDLSVLIPARSEQFLVNTIDDVLAHAELSTEVIAVLDGYWPDPPISDRNNLTLIHVTDPIGQRGATNLAARASTAKYIMKIDAHCSVDQGFDRKLIAPYEDNTLTQDVTTIPRLYNLHAFDWLCSCGKRFYQADPVDSCPICASTTFTQSLVWKPRMDRRTDFGRFDNEMHWQYWRAYERRKESGGTISELLSSIGACFLMPRTRFLDLDGLDEAHGFWGQFGTEVSCKSWLSGGRQVVNKRTWYSHLFRVGKLRFPYHLSGEAQERARIYSRDLWLNDKWPLATRPLSWLIDHFAPIPTWHPEAK